MKTTKQIVTLCLGIAMVGSTVLLTNCKKDKKTEEEEVVVTPPTPETNTQKLSNKNFKVTAITVNPGVNNGSAVITDWYASAYYDACNKDNIIKFNTNGTFTEDEGVSVCAGSPQTTQGTWVWNPSETILTVTSGTDAASFSILVNDGTTLKGTITENFNGTNYVFTYTWSKQ